MKWRITHLLNGDILPTERECWSLESLMDKVEQTLETGLVVSLNITALPTTVKEKTETTVVTQRNNFERQV